MIPEFTREQLETLIVPDNTPLVICDVDEVVVHFTRAFEHFIAEHGLFLDVTSFAINGNIKDRKARQPVPDETVAKLIDDFFIECTEHLHPVDGAVEALMDLSNQATVVMLTNLPHHAREKRINNLRRLGLPFPVVTNSGPKGPAIRHLAASTTLPVIFVDDSPGFVSSCFEHAPHVHIVHFLHDERFARHMEPLPYVSLTTATWAEAHPHIRQLLG